MRVEWSQSAVEDLRKIAVDSRAFGDITVRSVESRVLYTIFRLSRFPESAQKVAGVAGVRAAPLVRYPFVIFYKVLSDSILILRIRNTAQHPWDGR